MSNGTLINFDFYFLPSQDPERVIQEIDLKDYGKLTFEIDVTNSYGKIISDDYNDVINKFIENYDVESKHLGKN